MCHSLISFLYLATLLPITTVLARFNVSANGRVLENWSPMEWDHLKRTDPLVYGMMEKMNKVDDITNDAFTPKMRNTSAPIGLSDIHIGGSLLLIALGNKACGDHPRGFRECTYHSSKPGITATVMTDCVARLNGTENYIKLFPHPAVKTHCIGVAANATGAVVPYIWLSPPFYTAQSSECNAVGASTRVILHRTQMYRDNQPRWAYMNPDNLDHDKRRNAIQKGGFIAFASALFRSLHALHRKGILLGNFDRGVTVNFSPPLRVYFNIDYESRLMNSTGGPTVGHNASKSPWELLEGKQHSYNARDEVYRALDFVSRLYNPVDKPGSKEQQENFQETFARKSIRPALDIYLGHLRFDEQVRLYANLRNLNRAIWDDSRPLTALDCFRFFESIKVSANGGSTARSKRASVDAPNTPGLPIPLNTDSESDDEATLISTTTTATPPSFRALMSSVGERQKAKAKGGSISEAVRSAVAAPVKRGTLSMALGRGSRNEPEAQISTTTATPPSFRALMSSVGERHKGKAKIGSSKEAVRPAIAAPVKRGALPMALGRDSRNEPEAQISTTTAAPPIYRTARVFVLSRESSEDDSDITATLIDDDPEPHHKFPRH